MNAQNRRVVITGRGVISSLGHTPEELFRNLEDGKSGVRFMTEWPGKQSGTLGAPVALSEEEIRSIPRTFRRSMGGVALYAALASRSAVKEAGLTEEFLTGGDCGCVVGSTMGSANSLNETYRILLLGNGMEEMSSMQFFKCVSHTAAFNTANLFGITGVVQAPSAACASGLQAIGQGYELIASGAQEAVICGGADEISPEVSGSFELIYAGVSNWNGTPETAARPFDADRKGLVCGEGAGILVLEEYEHARKRGAQILGEILGYATCGGGSCLSQSDSGAILRCMERVFRNAGVRPEETDWISAHATATVQGDREEAEAIRRMFGDRVPVSSLKGHLGHTLGASGALETAVLLESAANDRILPTRNLNDPGDCGGLHHIRKNTDRKIRMILKNCFAFGGINATLLFCMPSR